MSKQKAREFVRKTQLSGYRHHSFELEHKLSNYLLKGRGNSSLKDELTIDTYEDILAPERPRAIKNSLICFLAIMSRSVISKGVDPERSFSLSDYYINEIEQKRTKQELHSLLGEIVDEYRTLLQETELPSCSLTVRRAIQYINGHIYGQCNVQEMAKAIGYNPQYLSTIFKVETGETPIAYIRRKKMAEAISMLMEESCPVNEVAEALGYCNTSYFIREFKRLYGKTPKQYTKTAHSD